jgi:hypothetical protein
MSRRVQILTLVAALFAGPVAVESLAHIAPAVAEELRTGSPPDAGVPDVTVVADHAVVTTETKTVTPLPPVLTDPVDDPAGFAQDVKGAFKTSQWFFLVVLALFGLARALLYASTRWSLPWLKRWAPVLVTASGLLAAVGASLGATGSVEWQPTLGALFAALAIYLRPEAKAAPKAVG